MEYDHKQVIVVRKDLKMRRGKEIAQGCHASLGAILGQMTREGNKMVLDLSDDRIEPWITGRFKKITVTVNSEQELLEIFEKAKSADIICSLIQDSGLTEFAGVKTLTTVAIGPDRSDKIDSITGLLHLY